MINCDCCEKKIFKKMIRDLSYFCYIIKFCVINLEFQVVNIVNIPIDHILTSETYLTFDFIFILHP